MNITLYKIADDKNVLNKTLSNNVALTCTARDTFAVTGGSIDIESSADLTQYNYCYIAETHRYYFINTIDIVRNGLYRFNIKVDVLMTYKTDIKNLTGTVDRQENLYNGYIQDGKYQALAYNKIVTKTFPNAMTQDNLILMTVG